MHEGFLEGRGERLFERDLTLFFDIAEMHAREEDFFPEDFEEESDEMLRFFEGMGIEVDYWGVVNLVREIKKLAREKSRDLVGEILDEACRQA